MAWLVLVLVVVPIVEIYLLVRVGQEIGAGPTIFLLIAFSVIGYWLMRHEGRRAWLAVVRSLQAGRMPNRELADGALVLAGGALLIVPGFLTDAVGLLMVLPFTRPLVRGLLLAYARRRLPGAPPAADVFGDRRDGPSPPPGRTVSGEIVDDEDPPGRH